ncbi:conserved hypothetical protein [Segniliparus rotundus DSM 44985]|uniref:Head-to-tail adaptor n=1 Tax=Segniliparus rotundus (strain ATCC BAA-972 / CDC 1076 / CIP 108378 / DSM 44985 / JCM 13578) TaxID=640132 RepID=D6Z9N4_SEGRD|nr:hypothetical protein [Segniliparus rotundus]ADG96561.1 conserved hypothetical protein [Segniliparus rotundus DSM 44985]
MPAVTITPADLAPFAVIEEPKALAMIADALAMARLVAPCVDKDDFPFADAAKAVIRGAILRWEESGSGAISQQTAGPFGQTLDTRSPRRGMFLPSEIEQLQKMCRNASSSGAFSIDTAPNGGGVWHDDACNLAFGASWCSCGANLTGDGPLWGTA